MRRRRLVLVLTALAMAVLAGVFVWVGWATTQAGQIAIVVTALVGVAALGVAAWAALPAARPGGSRASGGDTRVGEEAVPTERDATVEQHAKATDQARIHQAGRDQHINGR